MRHAVPVAGDFAVQRVEVGPGEFVLQFYPGDGLSRGFLVDGLDEDAASGFVDAHDVRRAGEFEQSFDVATGRVDVQMFGAFGQGGTGGLALNEEEGAFTADVIEFDVEVDGGPFVTEEAGAKEGNIAIGKIGEAEFNDLLATEPGDILKAR